MKKILKTILITAAILPFFVYSYASADVQGQNVNFIVNSGFDKLGRSNMTATLRHIGENAYLYVDDEYWNTLNALDRQRFLTDVSQLSSEFDNNIYPTQTTFWGQEAMPGVDGDNRLTILLEQLKSGNGGYFSTVNGYSKSVAPESNEREMLVVSAESVKGPFAKIFLAHEFQHLISQNQKELLRNAEEDVWMNELRSEHSITLVGYNNNFSGSNLERRAETFFSGSSDSLTEWPNVSLDYSLVALFGEYIAEELEENFLRDTLQNNLAGISSFNAVLTGRGAKERFIDIFSGWLAASYINDESTDPRFGYARQELKNFKATPQRLTILSDSTSSPQAGSEMSAFDYSLKPWQAYGHKFFVGGALSGGKIIKLSPAFNSKFAYADNLGRFSVLDKDFYVNDPTETRPGTGPSPGGGLQYFFIFPINDKKLSDFGTEETPSVLSLNIQFVEKTLAVEFGSALKDGSLIKKAHESEVYVIEGKYKRYLRPEIIALYGHLTGVQPLEVDETTFHSYATSNYVKYVGEEPVYAVWPDGTKHWLNITPQQWDASGRDWGAIFIINDLELNAYQIGADITR